jgi:hypothetical protein
MDATVPPSRVMRSGPASSCTHPSFFSRSPRLPFLRSVRSKLFLLLPSQSNTRIQMKLNKLAVIFFSTPLVCSLPSEAASVFYHAAPITDANIVQNGDFDTPNPVFGIPNWDISRGMTWGASDGVGGGSFVGIGGSFSQVLTTQPGQTYLLRFYTASAIPGISQSGPYYGLSVTWDSDAPIHYTFTQESYNWVPENLQVTAKSSQTLLTFARIYGSIPYIDAVSVVPIPEPGSVCFSFVSLISLTAWRVYRHQHAGKKGNG